jgi:ParB family chromosome partitioning protein
MTNKEENHQLSGGNFEVISIDLIDDPKNPIRTDLSPETLQELIASIRQFGIIEPLVVKRVKERFEVIAGHRRLVAAGHADLIQVPCYIFNVPEEEAEFVKIHENMYREEINPSDQAEHFSYLIQHFKLSPAKIAKLIGKSETFVSERLQILSYPEELREALDLGKIKYSVAREFYRLKDIDKLREYLNYAIRSGIVPSLAKQWVEDFNKQQQPASLPTIQGDEQTEIPHYQEQQTTCVYCTETVPLSAAEIVYIHPICLKEITKN